MYVVTGGAGFIGSHVVAALAARRHEVVVCDWLRSDQRWRNLAKHEIADVVAPEALSDWLRGNHSEVDMVIHMGAISRTNETDIDLIILHNVRRTLSLLQWCSETKTRFIYASSAATYGDGARGFDDALSCASLALLRPLNAYGWSKHVVDRRIARLVEQEYTMPPQWAGLKFFNVYGPNEYHKGDMQSVIAKNFSLIQAGRPLSLYQSLRPDFTDGGQLRDFVYVQDCVDVILWLVDHEQTSGLFNLGTGKARSWLDLAFALFDAAGQPRNIEFIDMPQALRGNYQYFTEARMDRLRSAGYSLPFTPLEDGVSKYVKNYLATDDPFH